jgi:hypothetical protein
MDGRLALVLPDTPRPVPPSVSPLLREPPPTRHQLAQLHVRRVEGRSLKGFHPLNKTVIRPLPHKGTPNKRTVARRLAEAEAAASLPEQFQGNALALLQAVYRNTRLDLRVRVDAASKALPYEVPKPEFATPAGDVVPLHERLRAYARARAIQASEGKVVDTGQSQKERLGLQPVHRHRQDLDENDPAFRSKTFDDAEGINGNQAPLPRASNGKVVEFCPERLTGVAASAVDASTDDGVRSKSLG